MTLYWIIHNPIDNRAIIDIQPDPIDERLYQFPIRKCLVQGSVEAVDIKSAERRVFDITLPKGVEMDGDLYKKEIDAECSKKVSIELQNTIDEIVNKYIVSYEKKPEMVDYNLVEQIKSTNNATKLAVKSLVAVAVSDVDIKPIAEVETEL